MFCCFFLKISRMLLISWKSYQKKRLLNVPSSLPTPSYSSPYKRKNCSIGLQQFGNLMQFNKFPISWLELFGSDRWIREVHKRLEDSYRLFLGWLYMATTDQVICHRFNLSFKLFTLFLALWQTSLSCSTAQLDINWQLVFSKAFSRSLQGTKKNLN